MRHIGARLTTADEGLIGDCSSAGVQRPAGNKSHLLATTTHVTNRPAETARLQKGKLMFLRGSALTKRLKLASALLAAFVATLLSVAVASPAQATGISGCPYPKVCFYLTQADWNSGHSTA